MNLDRLKNLLEQGVISEEEYKSMIPAEDNVSETANDLHDKEHEEAGLTKDDIKKLIQSEVDKVRTKYSTEIKKKEEELKKVRTEYLSKEEVKQLEIQEKETALAERERAIQEKENRLYAIAQIKKAGLDDGSTKSLDLVDFIMSSDQSEIDKKVSAFKNLVNSFVKAEVDRTFKANGKTPAKSAENGTADNPFAKSTFNLTRQMQLYAENPELAAQLERAAKGN